MLAFCTSSLRSKLAREACPNLIRPQTLSRFLGIPKFYSSKSEYTRKEHVEEELDNAKYDTVRVVPNAKKINIRKGLYMLSNLDQTLPFPMDILFSFETNNSLINVDAGRILKQSLSKALEVYYPLAGRVKIGLGGKMVVDCDVDGGVPFAEAFFDKDMATAVGEDITMIDRKLAKKLVYHNHTPYETALDVPPLAIRVNRFRCGGMILGLRLNHVMFDGIRLAYFLKSWSEIARGLPLSIKPQLDRSILSPTKSYDFLPQAKFEFIPFTSLISHDREKTIVNKSFIFTPKMLSRLRELAKQNNKNELAPTTFELISALTWKCWTKAKKLGPDDTSRVGIAVDGHLMLQPHMPKGYFGNCFVISCAQSRVRDLTTTSTQSLSYAIGTVHDAIKIVTGDYITSVIDFLEVTRKSQLLDNVVGISQWTRIPFYEIDYGWGVPSQVAPGANIENLISLLSHGKDSKNLVLSVILPVDAMEVFQELITLHLNETLNI